MCMNIGVSGRIYLKYSEIYKLKSKILIRVSFTMTKTLSHGKSRKV